MGLSLYDYQSEAIDRMKNGCILCGGVGSGKSRTALAYYFFNEGGELRGDLEEYNYLPMGDPPRDLYIITTARKRDELEWEAELCPFLLSTHPEVNLYSNNVVVDSWNNIKKYTHVYGAFFIFDEQRVIGSGTWVKAFLKIARKNHWIILSATPGDTWQDYIPVFVANGFYKNKTEFQREHIIYSRFTKYPQIERYVGTKKLMMYRDELLITMDFDRQTKAHHEDIFTTYQSEMYKKAGKDRWDPYKNEPIINAAGLCYIWRKIVNTDPSRQLAMLDLVKRHPKTVVFYNFDYELDILRNLEYGPDVQVAEWNGHKHQPIPCSDKWVYLVQYTAGAEGWNCVQTDTIIFYSQSYSYKVMAQAAGRIDRLNTPFKDIYYYHLKSHAGIDLAIARALREKRKFNESKFVKW